MKTDMSVRGSIIVQQPISYGVDFFWFGCLGRQHRRLMAERHAWNVLPPACPGRYRFKVIDHKIIFLNRKFLYLLDQFLRAIALERPEKVNAATLAEIKTEAV